MSKLAVLLAFFMLSLQHAQCGVIGHTPTEFEQYSLMLINRARADQDAEATRVGLVGGVTEGTFMSGPVNPGFKQPLAFDMALMQLACDWNMTIDASNNFAHGSNSARHQRAINFGFTGDIPFIDENLSVSIFSSGSPHPPSQGIVSEQHELLFLDSGVLGRGHRVTTLDETYQVVGISIASTMGVLSSAFNDVLQVQNFGSKSGSRFLTGAVFNDVHEDMFYTPDLGEALADFLVEARALDNSGTLSSSTWSSGGFSLELDPLKSYELTLKNSFGQLIKDSTMTLAPGTLNFEYTFMNPSLAASSAVPEPSSVILFLLLGIGSFLWSVTKNQ